MKKPRRGFPPGAHFVSFNFGNNPIWGGMSMPGTTCRNLPNRPANRPFLQTGRWYRFIREPPAGRAEVPFFSGSANVVGGHQCN